MGGDKKLADVCQPYFNTNSCDNGGKCILKHIEKGSTLANYSLPPNDIGRTFAILPFSDLKQQTILTPSRINLNSILSSNASDSKSFNHNKLEPPVSTATNKDKNLNHQNDFVLTKAQKKRNRRKTKSAQNESNLSNKINERSLCPKSKTECLVNCKNLHGDICDLCSRPAMHPLNGQFRREHSQQCVKHHEEKMKEELATFRSVDKQCGICFEAVMQKKGDCRFAILPDCNHCFCLVCIKIWRKSAGFGKAIRKSCPECRVVSHYVCPNTFWAETKADKVEVIQKYKDALAKVDCRYFAKDQKCPFGNKCFYKHCKDGTAVDLGSPRRRARNRAGRDRVMMNALLDMFLNDDDSEDFEHDYEFDLEPSGDEIDNDDSDYDDTDYNLEFM